MYSNILSFIEQKIQWGEETEEELDLYIDYRWHGKKVFKESKHKRTLKKLRKEIEEWEQ